jgi:hypothetical protein
MTSDAGGEVSLKVTDDLVASLVATQFPDLAELDVGRHYTLENHVAVRLGDHDGAVFPTLPGYDDYFARATDLIAAHGSTWTFPWNGPVRTGEPGEGFPYHWVIVPWISASTAAYVPLKAEVAPIMARALTEVHTPAPPEAPLAFEGTRSLEQMADTWEELLDSVSTITDPTGRRLNVEAACAIWDAGIDAGASTRWTWIHGSLEPRAVLSDQGDLAGIVLWHCFGAGNPEYDLACAALLFPLEAQEDLYRTYGSVSTEARARIGALALLTAVRYLTGADPYRTRLAWRRLQEWGLTA